MAAPKSSIAPGTVFGFLTVIETLPGTKKPPRVLPHMRCQCICGDVRSYLIQSVRKGERQSCGCRPNERQCVCTHCGQPFLRLGKVPHTYCSAACRFWSKVDATGGPDACWPWKPASEGRKRIYGSFLAWKVDGVGKFVDAHKFAYELEHGPVPDGLNVCHTCDNPLCCNTKHHFLGTNSDNISDAVAKGRARWGHSPSGIYRRK